MESRGITSATNTSPYVSTPPSEPTIISPYRSEREFAILASIENAIAMDLTSDEYDLITSNRKPHQAEASESGWDYSQRRRAHEILDWLFLGPFTVLRDENFLREAGITTIIPVRYVPDPSARTVFNSIGSNAVTRKLGITIDPIDIRSDLAFPGVFSVAVKKINDGVLAHARSHPLQQALPNGLRHNAKVLVVCETGNHRSALVVAAYLTAMFNMSLHDTLSYLSSKRFSADLEDLWKRHIMTWSEILQARRDVSSFSTSIARPAGSGGHKRTLDETFDDDGQSAATGAQGMSVDYSDRPEDRRFVPFTDADDMMM
ncbi:FMI2 protein [Plectosphaerella plurivora]|uniref:FMI2 protein n=1 Tax=Plectosphaerella plurivora TaxID=936078 RepID=A0A9P8VIY2_9PEZI|nr:FMI2 protein [Plectosphaerella plurivora]